jgi:hypothetical protein
MQQLLLKGSAARNERRGREYFHQPLAHRPVQDLSGRPE